MKKLGYTEIGDDQAELSSFMSNDVTSTDNLCQKL